MVQHLLSPSGIFIDMMVLVYSEGFVHPAVLFIFVRIRFLGLDTISFAREGRDMVKTVAKITHGTRSELGGVLVRFRAFHESGRVRLARPDSRL